MAVERLEDRCLLSTLQGISLPPPNQPPSDTAAGASDSPSVSADGHYVVFESKAPNLVAGQTGAPDVDNVYLKDTHSGAVTLVSHVPGQPNAAPASGLPSYSPIISADGNFILFGTEAPEFAPGLTPFDSVVVLYDRRHDTFTLVSNSLDSHSDPDAISGNGAYVLFVSDGSDLVSGQSSSGAPGTQQLFLYQTGAAPGTQIVSHAFGQPTVTGDFGIDAASIGANGRVNYAKVGTASVADNGSVAYVDRADNLVNPSPGPFQVYLYNPTSQTNQLVSFVAGSPTTGAFGPGLAAAISADGSTVAYVSDDDVNLVSNQSGPEVDNVFRYTAPTVGNPTGTNTLVSHASASPTQGGDANSGAGGMSLAVSSDGQFIAFTSQASDLVANQTGQAGNVFLYKASDQSITLVSGVNGSATLGAGGVPDLTPGGTPTGPSGVSVPADPITDAEFLGGPQVLSMSANGGLIAYVSLAGDLVLGQSGAAADNVFLYTAATGRNSLVSGANGSATAAAALESSYPVLSGDGSLLAFHSLANNLSAALFDGNGVADLFTYTPGSSGVALVSRAAFQDPEAPGDSFSTSVSADGRYTVFVSNATNLVFNQVTVNSQQNVFLFDKATGQITLVNHVPGAVNTTGDGGVHADFFPDTDTSLRPPAYVQPVISADGSTIAFTSFDDDLVSNETIPPDELNQTTQPGPVQEFIYLYHVTGPEAGTVTLVNHMPGATAQDLATVQAPPAPDGIFYDSFQPVISADGQYVAFVFGKPGDDGVGVALYSQALDKLGMQATTVIAFNPAAANSDFVPRNPSISDDGQRVVYESGDTGTGVSLYEAGVANPIQVASQGSGAVISHNGSTVAFVSTLSNLVSGQQSSGASGLSNVFLYSVSTGAVRLVSGVHGSSSLTADGASDSPAVDGDGGYVAYRSDADDLVAAQSGPAGNIFEFNALTSSQTLVSRQAGAPAAGAGGASEPVIDDDGHLISYVSTAGDLIPGQSGTAGVENVFVWLRQTGANILASGQGGSPTVGGNADSDSPLLTRDSFPGFSSTASDLVNGLGGVSVAYINTLVSVALSPNTIANDSPAGTVVGTLAIDSLLEGVYLPPRFSPLAAGVGDDADFTLDAGSDTLAAAVTLPYAAGGYTVEITVDVGFGPDTLTLPVFVAPPAPPRQAVVGAPTAPVYVLNADGSLVEQRPDALGGPLLLSPAGTILAVSTVAAAAGDVVFAITTSGNSLYEHTPSGWTDISDGYFGQVSAATDKAGDAVVFGVLGALSALPNSLYEHTPAGWAELSPAGTILSVSATSTPSGETAFAVVTAGDNLWEHFADGAWREASGGSFLQVSAGLNAAGQAVAYGVLTDHELWEFNPAFAGAWRELSPAGTIQSVGAGAADTVFAVTADGTLWTHRSGWAEASSGSFARVGGSPTSANDAVFAVLTDGSLWEHVDAGWLEILNAAVTDAVAP